MPRACQKTYRENMSESLDPIAVTAMVHSAIPALGRLGLEVVAMSAGNVELRMPLEPNKNHIGTMYAGALMSLAEVPGGLLPLGMPELGVVPIVTNFEVEVLRPARTDATLHAAIPADQLRQLARQAHDEGKAEFILETEALDAHGNVLLRCTGTYQLRPAG